MRGLAFPGNVELGGGGGRRGALPLFLLPSSNLPKIMAITIETKDRSL